MHGMNVPIISFIKNFKIGKMSMHAALMYVCRHNRGWLCCSDVHISIVAVGLTDTRNWRLSKRSMVM